MRKMCLCFLLISLFLACKDEGSVDMPVVEGPFAVDIGNSEIPYIVVSTGDVDIEAEPKVPALMEVFINKESVHSENIGIEYRGASSLRLSSKRSYGIETWDVDGNDIDASFFGFPEEEDWILLGHVIDQAENRIFDRTLLYNYLGHEFYRSLGRYASRTEFVELEVNGAYLGVYLFMEKLKRDKDRIDLAKLKPDENSGEDLTGGYILKIDKTSGGESAADQPLSYYLNNWNDDARYDASISFRSAYDIYQDSIEYEAYGPPYHSRQYLETYFLYEYPKAEDISDAQKAYIQNYIHEFERALISDDFSTSARQYLEYIELGSFVDYFLINELCRNVDAFRLSTFLSKDKAGKLQMGPVWDFNIGFDRGGRVPLDGWVVNYNSYVNEDPWMMPFWWTRFLEDPIFRQAVKDRWTAIRLDVLSTTQIHELVDVTSGYLTSNNAITRNFDKWWPSEAANYNSGISELKEYLSVRASWMDSEIGAF